MLKKIAFFALIGVSFIANTYSGELERFDKGSNFQECLSNCRTHHREALNLPRGAGKGICWDSCKKAHTGQGTEVIKEEYEQTSDGDGIFRSLEIE